MQSLLRRYLDFIYFDMVKKRLAAQLDVSNQNKVDTFVDLGCYVGYNTQRIQEVLSPHQTYGLEFNPQAIKEARQKGVRTICHNLDQPIPLRSSIADVITVFDVLEHLVETWQFVTEVYRILKPGGLVIIDSPNLAAWHNIVLLILGLQPSTGPHLISIADSDLTLVETMHRRDHDLDSTKSSEQTMDALAQSKMHRHLVVPTYWSLRRILIKAGFQFEHSQGFGYFPFPPPLSDWLCKFDIGHAHHYLIWARKPR